MKNFLYLLMVATFLSVYSGNWLTTNELSIQESLPEFNFPQTITSAEIAGNENLMSQSVGEIDGLSVIYCGWGPKKAHASFSFADGSVDVRKYAFYKQKLDQEGHFDFLDKEQHANVVSILRARQVDDARRDQEELLKGLIGYSSSQSEQY